MLQTDLNTSSEDLPRTEVRLLLLASCTSWTAEQKGLAAALVPHVTQWDAFIDTALRKYALPMVYRNLSDLPEGPPPADILATMHSLSLQATVEMLQRQAAFGWFHENCVIASGVEHAYFKGPALAARFYPDPALRFYRDIDILVPKRQRIEFIRLLQKQGCEVFLESDANLHRPDLNSDRAMSEYLFVTPVPHLLTPQQLVIELHTEIDTHTSLFDTEGLLSRSFEVTAQKHRIRILPDAEHIVFTCYHHTRHLWSKLNWLADLDAIAKHPTFNRDNVLATARSLNIESTVLAALDMHSITAQGRDVAEVRPVTPGANLLQACVDGLPGDLALERLMRRNQRLNVIGFAWQKMPIPLWRYAWIRIRKFRPTYQDLHAVDNRPILRYNVAIILRVLRVCQTIANRVRSR